MDYKHFLGRNKKDIIAELGQDFNYYPAHCWFYTLGKDWLGRNKILTIYFNNDEVIEVKIKKCYGQA